MSNDVTTAPDANTFPILLTQQDTKNKTYIVTGSNQGLGLEAARYLVSLGASKVILTSRNPSSGASAIADIETSTGIKGVAEVWPLDLASYSSVKAFAAKANELDRLDGVIQNAGVALDVFERAEGHELNVTVNAYSTLLLAVLLLPKLRETGRKFETLPYLVNVTTSYCFQNEKDVKQIRESGVESLDVEKEAVMDDRYAVSKMVGLLATWELAELYGSKHDTDVVINTVCPGLVKTKFIRHRNEKVQGFLQDFYAKHGREVAPASRAYLHAVNAGRGSHGRFLRDCEDKQDAVPAFLIDVEGKKLQKIVWEGVSKEIERVAPGALQAAFHA